MFGSSSTINIFVVPMNSPSWTNLHSQAASCAGYSRRCMPFLRREVDRQRDRELAALLRRAFYRHISAMRLRDVADKRKPKSGTLGVVHQRVAAAVELFKDLFLLGGCDADAAIGHFQLDAAIRAVQAHPDVLLVF